MIGRDLYFDYFYAAFLIPVAIILIILMISLFRHRQQCIKKYTFPTHLKQLLEPRSNPMTLIKNTCWVLAWLFACFALMGPKGNLSYFSTDVKTDENIKISKQRTHDIIFLIDTSASMNVQDESGGLSRLDKGKQIMTDVVSLLDGQNGALDVFTSDLSPVVPPTLDYIFLRLIIKEIFINEGYSEGTDLEKALLTLRQRTFVEPSQKIYTVILLSDGGDNQFESLKGKAQIDREKAILAALPNVNQFNLKIFTVGLGSIQGGIVPGVMDQGRSVQSVLHVELLKKIAQEGKGLFYQSEKWTSRKLAQALMRQIENQDVLERTTANEKLNVQETDIKYDLYFQIPLGIALLLMLMAYFLPSASNLRKEIS